MKSSALYELEQALIDLRAMITICLRLHEAMSPTDLQTVLHELMTMYYLMLEKVEAAEIGTNQLFKHEHHAEEPV